MGSATVAFRVTIWYLVCGNYFVFCMYLYFGFGIWYDMPGRNRNFVPLFRNEVFPENLEIAEGFARGNFEV